MGIESADANGKRFFWDEIEDVIAGVAGAPEWSIDPAAGRLTATGRAGVHRVTLPSVLPIASNVQDIDRFIDTLPDALGRHLVLLLQAGAATLGMFEEGSPIATKTIKKYVVRGSGRAQPTHLASKGKSRYGSRLRLQNARRLERAVHEKLGEWIDLYGGPSLFFRACPVRLWSGFINARAALPRVRRAEWIRIRRDLPVPTTGVMLKAYRELCTGTLTRVE